MSEKISFKDYLRSIFKDGYIREFKPHEFGFIFNIPDIDIFLGFLKNMCGYNAYVDAFNAIYKGIYQKLEYIAEKSESNENKDTFVEYSLTDKINYYKELIKNARSIEKKKIYQDRLDNLLRKVN